ncbi:MAG: hypothetical protein ACI4OZ_05980 [Akkermansia sp.]
MEGSVLKVLDTRGDLRCVRFASGNLGVVDGQDVPVVVVGPMQQLRFASHDFLRVRNGREFFVDMRNGAIYAEMPELLQFGPFELAHIGGFLCTRTRKLYEVEGIPAEVVLGREGLFLTLPFNGMPEERVRRRMVRERKWYEVCLLNGDESGVYWVVELLDDWSLIVMDEAGSYFHVTRQAGSGRAVKRLLGRVECEADRMMVMHAVQEVEEQVALRMKRAEERERRAAERSRKREMAQLMAAEPFQIGKKWGLRMKGRIVVPPIYRTVEQPVGSWCAFEAYPGCWGVMAVDGRTEVEPRYEHVVIWPDGQVDLTVRPGKVIRRKL